MSTGCSSKGFKPMGVDCVDRVRGGRCPRPPSCCGSRCSASRRCRRPTLTSTATRRGRQRTRSCAPALSPSPWPAAPSCFPKSMLPCVATRVTVCAYRPAWHACEAQALACVSAVLLCFSSPAILRLPQHACLQVYLLSKHTGKEKDEIERTIVRPRYFNPYEAVDFGIIDRVRPRLCPPASSRLLHSGPGGTLSCGHVSGRLACLLG